VALIAAATLVAATGAAAAPAVTAEPGTGAEVAAPAPVRFSYDVPVLADSPWPQMRRDSHNTASSPIRGRYRGDRPWSYRTGRGIFSTPVLGADETVYVGSADGAFYALDRRGKRRWRFRTGGIIDAAAALGARARGGGFPITVGSGDETLYQLRSANRRLARGKRIRWRFRTGLAPATGQLVNWWEGNPAYGGDGNLYVGNTGGGAFSLTPQGEQRWVVQRANSVWTTPAFDAAGNSYWGSVDFFAFSLDPAGGLRWQTFTPGYITASPALGSDGTVYTGSFDRSLYALDPGTGAVRWSFPTADHIYSSPALAANPEGATAAIYIGSADGSVYALGADGRELWRYDTGDPIRSSPVLGRAPRGPGRIVYVGSSNGKLYALDAETGRRRWSFDTTPAGSRLADRNDLNGSPALGRRGVYIGGEHGRVWFVPYDYCRKRDDRRCDRSPGQEFKADLVRVFGVTPGGTTLRGSRETVPAATVLSARLVVRRGGRTVDARIDPGAGSPALVSSRPRFGLQTQLSGDGHYLFIRPDGILPPGRTVRVRIAGGWTSGAAAGDFQQTLRIETRRSRNSTAELRVGRARVGALELSRLALPLPSLLPSVNQIGFDSYDLIAGTIAREPAGKHRGRLLLWVIGGRRQGNGATVADPAGGFAFPLAGAYRGDSLALNASGVDLQFSFGNVPLRSFDFRGRLDADGGFAPGAALYGQVTCADVPNYSAQLRIAGVCNETDTLAAYGTFLGEPYVRGGANERPAGAHPRNFTLTPPTAGADGEVVASIRRDAGADLPADRHLASIVLTDDATGVPVPLDYRGLTEQVLDSGRNLAGAVLRVPAGTVLPERVRGYLIVDVFGLATRELR
jgi:outer membrane protein assembly factor BamB